MRCFVLKFYLFFLNVGWFKIGKYLCKNEVVFTPCSVVIGGVNKYNLILRVLFSCFKPPTIITVRASERVRLLLWEV